METWIRTTFEIDGEHFRFWSRNALGPVLVEAPIAWFADRFGLVPVPPRASALKAVDPTDALGWHRHFDAWVEQGIIQP